jgi:hypothetical protein
LTKFCENLPHTSISEEIYLSLRAHLLLSCTYFCEHFRENKYFRENLDEKKYFRDNFSKSHVIKIALVPPGRVYTTEAGAAPGRVYYAGA